MAYGDDVTEAIPYALSRATGIVTYTPTGENYDLAINGQPFFMATGDTYPYRRQTAQYRKNQVDQSNEPGEQSITGWWVRAQSSFHKGSGIKFYDPSSGEVVLYRFTDSKGVNVWEKGEVSLLKSSSQDHVTTGPIATNERPQQSMRSITWSGMDGVLLRDEYDVDKVYPRITGSITNKALTSNVATLTSTAHSFTVGMTVVVSGVDATFNGTYTITAVTANTFSYAKTASNVASTAVNPVGSVHSKVTKFVNYTAGAGVYPIYDVCDDGTYAYWVTNVTTGANTKFTMYKKPLTGNAADTSDEVKMFDVTGTTATNAIIDYVKERLVLCVNNAVYEVTSSSTSLPTAIYTHPTNGFTFTSITASGPAIYLAGYNGIKSSIIKFTLTTTGAMPTLSGGASVAAELPTGEKAFKIFYYLGYMMIGTNRGIRAALVSDQDGSISYGPLIVETSQTCYDFASRDHYVWCATSVDGQPGTIRIDLNSEIETLRFAYANDVYYDTENTNPTTASAFAGSTNRLMYASAYSSSTNGNVYCEDLTSLMERGSLTTGWIRYATLENKVFKNIKAKVDNNYGGLTIESHTADGNYFTIANFSEKSATPEVSVSYPTGSSEYISFRFNLVRSETSASQGPILYGYQLKSLPAIPRQRLIQYPLSLYDRELDTFGVQVGHEGAAFDRLQDLELVENSGDSIRIEDFRTGESYLGLIEEMQFINSTPSDKRYSGFGGILLLTIRTL